MTHIGWDGTAYGEDGIYFDHRGDCRDGALHKTCSGRWRGVVSLGFDADGKRVRRKVSGQTKAEVRDRLKALHSELDAGVRSAAGYTVEKAVADWLDEGLPGRTTKTVEANRDSLRPLLMVIGTIPLRNVTVQDVRTALKKRAGELPSQSCPARFSASSAGLSPSRMCTGTSTSRWR